MMRLKPAATRLCVRRLCTASGVVGAKWPDGLLQDSGGKRPTFVNASLADELLFEVGWQSRHALLDVRPAKLFSGGRIRGAFSVPYDPAASFVERAARVVEQIHLDQPPAQHLAKASIPRAEAQANDDEMSAKLVRLIVCGDDSSSIAFNATDALLRQGYHNALALDIGFDGWAERGFPCDSDQSDGDEFPDSTF